MALRDDQVNDARPTQTASPAASATPPGQFEAEETSTIVKTSGLNADADGVIENGSTDFVDHMQEMAAVAHEIEQETTARPQTSAERAVAVKENAAIEDAIAKRRSALVAGSIKRDTVVRALKHAIPVEDLLQMQIGTFPRLTVDVGGVVLDKTTEMGKWVEFEMLSWAPITLVVSGEKNDPEADKMIRSSYDGVTLDDGTGRTIVQYLAFLKDVKKYAGASAKRYTQVIGMLIATEKEPNPIAPENRKLYEISLAPTSTSQWQKYMLENGIRAARGGADDALIRAEQQRRLVKGNTFGVIIFDRAKTTTEATGKE